MLQFILERANYWAIISLMMIGLYIAFQSTNLIKKLVGLTVFQTSVFLFYITLGKVSGGTAPILTGKDAAGHTGGRGDAGHASANSIAAHAGETGSPAGQGDTGEYAEVAQADEVAPEASGGAEVEGAPADVDNFPVEQGGEPASSQAEELLAAPGPLVGPGPVVSPDPVLETAPALLPGNPTGLEGVYSNPLPHVLILTAIVVGVSTLAVGLALVVRIRESYGTIESDEVRAKDIETADAQDADEAVEAMV